MEFSGRRLSAIFSCFTICALDDPRRRRFAAVLTADRFARDEHRKRFLVTDSFR